MIIHDSLYYLELITERDGAYTVRGGRNDGTQGKLDKSGLNWLEALRLFFESEFAIWGRHDGQREGTRGVSVCAVAQDRETLVARAAYSREARAIYLAMPSLETADQWFRASEPNSEDRKDAIRAAAYEAHAAYLAAPSIDTARDWWHSEPSGTPMNDAARRAWDHEVDRYNAEQQEQP